MPMSSSLRGKVRSAYDFAIDFLGSEAVIESASTGAKITTTVGFRNIGRDDNEVVNAYGPGTVAITVSQANCPTEPMKFDQITIAGKVYTVQAAHIATLNGEIFGWRVYATGK